MKKLLLVAATTGYQTQAFAEAARRLGVHLTLATDRCHVLDNPWGDGAIPVRFDDPEGSTHALEHFDAVAAVGDRPAYLAALAAARHGVPFHPPDAVAASRNKFLARDRFRAGGLPVPHYFLAPTADGPDPPSVRAPYPCVLKALGLSASRGVIRAGNPAEFRAAFRRIQAILAAPDIARFRDPADHQILVEEFIPGREFAIEGLMTRGEFHALAVFDKPDPLDGPFFEETIYITPSSEPDSVQQAILETVRTAARSLGLWHGPVHAEVRVNSQGVWMLEAAARPIGGLCARALRFSGAMPLEELILRHALGDPVIPARLEPGASGVMMIPIPREGIYRGCSGIEAAATHAEVFITAKEGQHFLPLPEGHSYLGFLFARAENSSEVEHQLRTANSLLQFDFAAALQIMNANAANPETLKNTPILNDAGS
ncbi:MAG: ATP-grasp domain-containing protein [Acidobacteria bacterium]|nr:ATP-grasp domain-containing protein [Acidobacteriota bacterium]